jgi:hypothetical protein
VQLHQVTPNAFSQLSKYFWALMSFGGETSSDGFVKRYELHYHPKKVIVGDFERFQQFGVINFHARRGGRARMNTAIKNKWCTGWTSLVLVQGALARLLTGREMRARSAFVHERPTFFHRATF